MPQSAPSTKARDVSLFDAVSPAPPGNTPDPCPRRAALILSPFYHSAVNAVTEPARFVACSQYFVTRWMPLLGGEGTRIVLALRSLGYYNPKTGERRDQIVVGHAELAARVGCSEDTLTRQLALDRTTGLPRNPALARFVERERRVRRDPHTGRVWQEENAYRVSMDDPVHPDDWPRVEGKVAEREAQQAVGAKAAIPLKSQCDPARSLSNCDMPRPESARPRRVSGSRQEGKASFRTTDPPWEGLPEQVVTPGPQSFVPPGPQIAVSGGSPGPHVAESPPQDAEPGLQSAGPSPQDAVPIKESLYSSLPKNSTTTAAPAILPPGEGPAGAGGGSNGTCRSKPRPSDALRPQPGQTGFAAFREVAAQLRLLEKKRPSGRRDPAQPARPSPGTGPLSDVQERQTEENEPQEDPSHAHA